MEGAHGPSLSIRAQIPPGPVPPTADGCGPSTLKVLRLPVGFVMAAYLLTLQE